MNRDVLIFLVCVLIASSFWMLRVLNGNMTATLNIPVSATNIPDGFILNKSFEKSIAVQVEDKGFTILSYKLSKVFFPVKFDIGKVAAGRKSITISPKDVKQAVNSQLYTSTEVKQIQPDSIHFELSIKGTKRLPVVFQGKITAGKQFVVGKLKLSPDSVDVSGVVDLLDTVSQVETVYSEYVNLVDSVNKTLNLVAIHGLVYSASKVSVRIPVEPFTEESTMIPIVGINFPDSLIFRPMPSQVKVIYCTPLSQNIAGREFQIVVNYLDSTVITGETLHLKLSTIPEGVFNVRIEPSQIDYFIEQK